MLCLKANNRPTTLGLLIPRSEFAAVDGTEWGQMVTLFRWTSNQSNSLVLCPRWPLNSFWLQMNWKHNTVASVWHFPLLARVNPNPCRRQPVCQRIATASPVPTSAVHTCKHHPPALPINTPLVLFDENEQLKRSAASQHTPLKYHQISASINATISFNHSSAPLDTRPVAPLFSAEAESSAVTNIIIMFLNEYSTFICMS